MTEITAIATLTLTRTCPSCLRDLALSAFRDGVAVGRPPKHCAECRDSDPDLAAHQDRNRRRRASAVARQRGYAARDSWELLLDTIISHPDGYKICPVGTGCGNAFPVEHYAPNPYQADGLATHCPSCTTWHQWLSSLRRRLAQWTSTC